MFPNGLPRIVVQVPHGTSKYGSDVWHNLQCRMALPCTTAQYGTSMYRGAVWPTCSAVWHILQCRMVTPCTTVPHGTSMYRGAVWHYPQRGMALEALPCRMA